MKAFGRYAIFTTLATYFLIFVGGLVRVSGAGMGCPDWPKCFGRWIPPITINQLPPDINPSTFNLTLAWIEYTNRLIGVTVGFLILALAIWAIAKYRNNFKILIPSVLAALLTAFQGWQGSQLVATGLEPVVVSAHMVIALIIAGLLIYVSMQAYYQSKPAGEIDSTYPKSAKWLVRLLLLGAMAQVILGTQFRQAIETIAARFPLFSPTEIIAQITGINNIHMIFGTGIIMLALVTAFSLLSPKNKPSPIVWQSGWTLAALAVLQIIIGYVLLYIGFPAVTQVLHMWVASLMYGVILISYFAMITEGRQS